MHLKGKISPLEGYAILLHFGLGGYDWTISRDMRISGRKWAYRFIFGRASRILRTGIPLLETFVFSTLSCT